MSGASIKRIVKANQGTILVDGGGGERYTILHSWEPSSSINVFNSFQCIQQSYIWHNAILSAVFKLPLIRTHISVSATETTCTAKYFGTSTKLRHIFHPDFCQDHKVNTITPFDSEISAPLSLTSSSSCTQKFQEAFSYLNIKRKWFVLVDQDSGGGGRHSPLKFGLHNHQIGISQMQWKNEHALLLPQASVNTWGIV